MSQVDLFAGAYPDPPADDRRDGQRLTERLKAIAEQGINPLVGTRGPEGKRCGDCIHRKHFGGGAKSYPKCDLGPQTSGPKTDVRKCWPACHRYEPAE